MSGTESWGKISASIQILTSGFELADRCSMLLGIMGRRQGQMMSFAPGLSDGRRIFLGSENNEVTRIQGLAIAVLSLWVGWTLFMWFAATRSFRTVDEVLKSPPSEFSRDVESVKAGKTREILRYLASEINRTYFRAYGWGQLVLGTILLVLLAWRAPRDTLNPAIAAVMLFIVIILTLGVMPQIISLGRNIDFLPRTPPPPGYQRFWKLHAIFTSLDGAKLLGGIVLLIRLIALR